jgi:hypothetical protein
LSPGEQQRLDWALPVEQGRELRRAATDVDAIHRQSGLVELSVEVRHPITGTRVPWGLSSEIARLCECCGSGTPIR